MLDAVAALGYTGIELGPPGYFGSDAEAVAAVLEPFGLELVGAFAPLRIGDAEGFEEDLDFLVRTLEILAATGARGPVVLAGDENDVRLAAAGRPEATRETSLKGDDLLRAAERVERAASIAADRGVSAAFHPHTATYIESPEEVGALLEATDPALVKIAFDTGHTVVGGGDPVELARSARASSPSRRRGTTASSARSARARWTSRRSSPSWTGLTAGAWSSRTGSRSPSPTSTRCGRSRRATSPCSSSRPREAADTVRTLVPVAVALVVVVLLVALVTSGPAGDQARSAAQALFVDPGTSKQTAH